jgi:hypothetical protein
VFTAQRQHPFIKKKSRDYLKHVDHRKKRVNHRTPLFELILCRRRGWSLSSKDVIFLADTLQPLSLLSLSDRYFAAEYVMFVPYEDDLPQRASWFLPANA